MAQELMIPHRRPRLSASGAASRAPKKVPAERIETMRDSCGAVTAVLSPVEKAFCQLENGEVSPLVKSDVQRGAHCEYVSKIDENTSDVNALPMAWPGCQR